MSGTGTPRYAPAVVRQRLMAMAIGIVVLVILVQIAQAIIGIVYVGGLATPPEGWRESPGGRCVRVPNAAHGASSRRRTG